MGIWSAYRALREVLRSFRGALLVQVMSEGLWQGRQFRAYVDFSANTQLRLVCNKPFLLTMQHLQVDRGLATLRILTGATATGTWVDVETQQNKNRLPSNAYVAQNVLQRGGSFTGGVERERLRGNAGGGQGVSVDNIELNVRVLPAGTYYFDIVVEGTTSGIYYFEHEELDDL